MTRAYTTALLGLSLLAAGASWAQPMDGGFGHGRPAFFDNLFPPRMIMRHQAEIELSDSQRAAITKIIDESQKSLTAQQWDVERESEKLAKLLESNPVDEATALAQAEQTMSAEQRLKKAHLTQLIRIKNVLSVTQQQKLRALRNDWRSRRESRAPRGTPSTGDTQRD